MLSLETNMVVCSSVCWYDFRIFQHIWLDKMWSHIQHQAWLSWFYSNGKFEGRRGSLLFLMEGDVFPSQALTEPLRSKHLNRCFSRCMILSTFFRPTKLFQWLLKISWNKLLCGHFLLSKMRIAVCPAMGWKSVHGRSSRLKSYQIQMQGMPPTCSAHSWVCSCCSFNWDAGNRLRNLIVHFILTHVSPICLFQNCVCMFVEICSEMRLLPSKWVWTLGFGICCNMWWPDFVF